VICDIHKVETLRPEAKYQMSLYPMSLYNDTSPNHLLVHTVFFIEAAICYLHTAHIVLSYLCYFMLALCYLICLFLFYLI